MAQPSTSGKSHDETVPAMSASWKIVTPPAASVLVQDRTAASAEEEAEAIRTWQYLMQKRCSHPSILFWYLRVGCAGLLTYATLRRGMIRRLTNGKVRRLALIALALAYRLMRRPKQIFHEGISDIEDAFSKFKSPRVGGRFVNRDGVDIAYSTLGCGPKLVLLANGIGCRDVYLCRSCSTSTPLELTPSTPWSRGTTADSSTLGTCLRSAQQSSACATMQRMLWSCWPT